MQFVFMDKNTVYSEKVVITAAKEHDQNQLKVLADAKEAMYVFDRGYVWTMNDLIGCYLTLYLFV
ncbi:hypothetical protein [Bacillus aquiflavi]|uniref:hypothetical protein n=1 Tax=Bacillus aquiflavi TaxID=2672567 RepID=UPI0035A99BCC